ncbi:MAG: type I DNA topoisomerase [Pseudomonadota bacterium]
MAKNLIVVESPTKAKTLNKYLSKDFDILASKGHVKDLPPSQFGVDLENDFAAEYQIISGKSSIIKEIKKYAKKAENIYLAPDPDREGEAIAWHIAEELGLTDNIYRVLFNEFTKKKITEAVSKPLKLDKNKYEAQIARRILDRIVGYKISPLLWEKVRRGLSAGRVQSVALRIICEREAEILKFISEEYWSFLALFELENKDNFEAKLFKKKNKKIKVSNKEDADKIVKELNELDYKIDNVERKERSRHAAPPFITSTLQQEAFRKLRYPARKTMMVAQKLYEGMEVGGEQVGLITYMRTDSVRVSSEAVSDVRGFIKDVYGPEYLPEKPNFYKNRKSSQDAHEAIRPTSFGHSPATIAKYLKKDELALYRLIWNRFVASQMKSALYDSTTIDVAGGDYIFRATGSILKFKGFLEVYTEGQDNDQGENDKDYNLPDVEKGLICFLKNLDPKQHFTQPPPRFTESSLVKELEEKGVGRPSTYVSILTTIQSKEYVQKEKGSFKPTDLGMIVTELLCESFPKIMDVAFTAHMEEELDEIEEGKRNRLETLNEFYDGFSTTLAEAKEGMRNVKKEKIPTDVICEECGKTMVIRWGRNGRFLACSDYPTCHSTSEFATDEKGKIEIVKDEIVDTECPKCKGQMKVKYGKFGRFLSCVDYPKCKGTKPFVTGVKCPEENCEGEVIERRSKRGSVFYGCSKFPNCAFATWYEPVDKACPSCQNPILVIKRDKSGKASLVCIKHKCKYKEEVKEEE